MIRLTKADKKMAMREIFYDGYEKACVVPVNQHERAVAFQKWWQRRGRHLAPRLWK